MCPLLLVNKYKLVLLLGDNSEYQRVLRNHNNQIRLGNKNDILIQFNYNLMLGFYPVQLTK